MFKLQRRKLLIIHKPFLKRISCGILKYFNTDIKVYNSIGKKKEPLILKHKNLLTWYTCGPTVYDSAHLGHASCYVKLDIIQRILKSNFGLNLISVMNITDVDDKIINRSREKNVEPSALAKNYEKEFWQEMAQLNIQKPNIVLRVTDHIEIIKQFIFELVKSKHAYKSKDGSVYFDVSEYESYGKFRDKDKIDASEDALKKSRMDFALWKASKNDEISWDSPWTKGRPGWHIECSALASLALGNNIDIHAGGIDLQFPHHENEEAQSCAFHGVNQWVNYWIHTGHLHLKDSVKMSKSLKNTISIQELLKATKVDTFRMACFMSHYRSNMEYSSEYMYTAETVLKGYKNFFDSCRDYLEGNLEATIDSNKLLGLLSDVNDKVYRAYCDDFNTPLVVKYIGELVSATNVMLHSSPTSRGTSPVFPVAAVYNFVRETLVDAGFVLFEKCVDSARTVSENENEIIDLFCNFRQNIRQFGRSSKNQEVKEVLKLCDTVRDNMKGLGIVIKDFGEKSSWSRS